MRKGLSILGAIGLTATSTTSLISCEKPNNKNIPCEKQDHGNGKQQCSQHKPFNQVDNKGYFVVGKGNNQLNINKFKNDEFPKQIIPNSKFKDKILINYGDFNSGQREKELQFIYRDSLTIKYWSEDNGEYFKTIYRWDGLNEPETPTINPNTGEITDGKE